MSKHVLVSFATLTTVLMFSLILGAQSAKDVMAANEG
jgi:hypothetical protein